jgi:hypothetical protein
MAKQSESELSAQALADEQAQKAFVARTKTMSDVEAFEYISATMQQAASVRPQRRR